MKEGGEQVRGRNASARAPRMTPTYYHHNIFTDGEENMTASCVRVTPTFQSTVMNCDGYQIVTTHSRPNTAKEQAPIKQELVKKDEGKQTQQIQPISYNCSRVNDEKARISEDINHLDGRTSRLRKCVEMMSNPIFGGHSWTPFLVKDEVKKEPAYNPDLYRPEKEKPKENKEEVAPPIKQEVAAKQLPKVPEKPSIPAKINPNPKTKQKPTPNPKQQSKLKRFKSATTLKKH